MRTASKLALGMLALAVMLPAAALACGRDSDHDGFSFDAEGAPVRWADRQPADARFTMNSGEGTMTLVLTNRVVALQLSDKVMHKIDRKLREARREDDDLLGHTIKIAVLSGVSSALDHSAEVSLDDIRDVRYENGRLDIVTYDGRRLFRKTRVNDERVMESFSAGDARQFVREFQKAKARASAG